MIPGMNPRKMKKMMSKMGIQQEEIDAKRVVIEKEDKNIVIDNPSIIKIKMQGKENFQISGDVSEQEAGISEDDIRQVMEKTECSKKEARASLEKHNGDLAEAILDLS
jgi:nascent polypeptide-associated complex subunit alpha